MNAGKSAIKVVIPIVICAIVFICFRYSLHNSFTNWDDDVYVSNDRYIKALTPENLKIIFTEDITKNNFHPLCMLSLALNYYFSQLHPQAYYLTNILIHIANVLLVLLFCRMLCRRLGIDAGGTLFISSFVALWFGIHPMRVESVSWIAERKDVLYAFFYFAGLIAYLKNTSTGQRKWYIITFLLFVCSCLSKPMAVVFPLSLLCLDFLFNGKLEKKQITGKMPFFIGALFFGGLALYTQNKTGAIAPFGTLSFAERIMFGSYGFMMYIVKFFYPSFLSTFYPYPYRYISGWLPWEYYAAPVISLALIIAPIYATCKMNRLYFRIVAFGIGFFIVNILFVLQFISCGAAIMADRYTYVAYAGLFFIIAFFSWELVRRFSAYKITIITVLIAVSGWMGYLCSQRTHVWSNSETLLKDAIVKFPYRALLSYKWLGNYYFDKGELDSALTCYKVLAELRSADARVYDNIGNIYRLENDYGAALDAFKNSLKVQSNVYITYMDMSVSYCLSGDSVNAFNCFARAFKIYPGSEKIYADTGFHLVQRMQYNGATVLYSNLIKINRSNPLYYFYRGVSYFGTNRLPEAVSDWTIAVNFKAADASPAAAYNLSVAYDSLGNEPKALFYANLSNEMGYKVDSAYLAKLKSKLVKQNE